MDIPRGHAMLPLVEADLLDFIFNYYKAEYAPIRSFWSTATAEPRQPQRWVSMGHDLAPLTFRPANAQAQKDLEAIERISREKKLDHSFIRGLLVRFAKYEVHERLEKKLFEAGRLDLMVMKALKEKHLIDALWPSPAPRNIRPELLQQGVRVRQWYGDMFNKYFRVLRSLDDFSVRPEVDEKLKAIGTLRLVPFVEHLVFATVEPIFPIVARGAGYANSQAWKQKESIGTFGEPDRFEIRFDVDGEVEETLTRSVVRQCQCQKCGSKRDVNVVISLDPSPGPPGSSSATRPSHTNTLAPGRHTAKTTVPRKPSAITPASTQPQQQPPNRAASPPQKKPCPRCTFLNHPDLTTCEMCQGELSETLVSKPPSPPAVASVPRVSHSHSASLQPTSDILKPDKNAPPRPAAALNRHSLSSALFSILPFSQQTAAAAAAHGTTHTGTQPPMSKRTTHREETAPAKDQDEAKHEDEDNEEQKPTLPSRPSITTPTPTTSSRPTTPHTHNAAHSPTSASSTPPLSQAPQPAMMALTTSPHRVFPTGMPQSLGDYDFAPTPSFAADADEEEPGWGEISREDARMRGRGDGADGDEDEEDDEEEEEERKRETLIDLDAVAREEMGVWGDKEGDDDDDDDDE